MCSMVSKSRICNDKATETAAKYVNQCLNTECLDVAGSICSACEVRQVELYLVPAIIQSHWHCADEWFHTCCTLIVAGTETTTHILVIQYLIHTQSSPQICIIITVNQIPNNHWSHWST